MTSATLTLRKEEKEVVTFPDKYFSEVRKNVLLHARRFPTQRTHSYTKVQKLGYHCFQEERTKTTFMKR